MSESFYPTKQQIRIMKLAYNRNPTFDYLAARLHIPDVNDLREITGGEMKTYLHVALPEDPSIGYGPSVVTLTRDGVAFIERLMDLERDRRIENRHFWIGIFLGGLLGWLLTAFGTPKDLFQSFVGLFR